MFVKMLIHMHIVVYICWYWYICKRGGVVSVDVFMEINCLFSTALEAVLKKR